jgi:hypothetical protein
MISLVLLLERRTVKNLAANLVLVMAVKLVLVVATSPMQARVTNPMLVTSLMQVREARPMLMVTSPMLVKATNPMLVISLVRVMVAKLMLVQTTSLVQVTETRPLQAVTRIMLAVVVSPARVTAGREPVAVAMEVKAVGLKLSIKRLVGSSTLLLQMLTRPPTHWQLQLLLQWERSL